MPDRNSAVFGQPALLYTWPGMFHLQPGLGHMKEVARTLAIEASRCGRVGLLPPLRRSHHNKRAPRLLRWSDYFDWTDLPLHDSAWAGRQAMAHSLRQAASARIFDGAVVSNLSAFKEQLLVRCFGGPSIFGEWMNETEATTSPQLSEPAFSNRYPAAIVNHGERVIAEIGKPCGVLHIRRTDAASGATEPPAVIAHLHAKGCVRSDSIFVLTDETSAAYREALRAEFPGIVFEQDVAHLRDLYRDTHDNYIVFRVCKWVQSRYDDRGLGALRYLPQGPGVNHGSALARIKAGLERRWLGLSAVTPDWIRRSLRAIETS